MTKKIIVSNPTKNPRETFTSELLSKIGHNVPNAKTVTIYSMATGSAGTVNYKGNLYEIRITPVKYGIEKYAHPKTSRRR